MSDSKEDRGRNVTVDLVCGFDAEESSRGLRYEYVGAWLVSSIAPSSGPIEGGTRVTVRRHWKGSNSTSSCLFNGIRTSGTVLSSSSMRCASPAQNMAGPVNLRVEDTDGRGPGGEIVFEYHSVMTPSRMIPSSGPLMGGGFVTVGAMGMVPMDQEVHCMFTGSGSDE